MLHAQNNTKRARTVAASRFDRYVVTGNLSEHPNSATTTVHNQIRELLRERSKMVGEGKEERVKGREQESQYINKICNTGGT